MKGGVQRDFGLLVVITLLLCSCGQQNPTNATVNAAGTAEVQSTLTNQSAPHWVYQQKPPNRIAVVFVHGIFGDTNKTWSASDGPSFFDLLHGDPDIGKTVDIFAFGYPSTFTSQASFTIYEASDHLYQRLKFHHILDYPTIVFVAHSMGGLVTLETIIDHADVRKLVPLVVLYSTPGEGSEIANIADHVANNPALKNMIPINGQNDGLKLLSNQWKRTGPRPKVYCAYEKLPTAGILIVNWSSADHYCDFVSDAIAANHVDIVKLHSREDDSYVTFANAFNDVLTPISANQIAGGAQSATSSTGSVTENTGNGAKNERPKLRYTYEHLTNQKLCTGRLEKYEDVWSEFIPNDSSCNEVRVDFVELGRDAEHFYIYDPNRNLTDRVPINGGGVEWILGRVPPNDGHKEGWGPVYQATVVSK